MGELFSPKMPKLPKPAPMPDPQSREVMESRRRRQQEMMARGGREGTILSDSLSQSAGKLGA